MELFYAHNDEQQGPIDLPEFNQLRRLGTIRPHTLVFTEGMDDWAPLEEAEASGQVPALQMEDASEPVSTGVASPAPPATLDSESDSSVNCPNCGRPVDPANLIPLQDRQVCPACRDMTLQQIREGVSSASIGGLNYAGFGIRFVSSFVDGLIMQVYGFVLGLMFGLSTGEMFGTESGGLGGAAFVIYMILSYAGPIAYIVYFMGNPKFQATPGMMAAKLKVVRPDGSRITYLRAFGRYLASFLSSIILMIGYLMLIWDDEKRTLHDRIADTRIVYK